MKTVGIPLLIAFVLWPVAALSGGSYLLIPPVSEGPDGLPRIESHRPLKEWVQLRAYDTAEACQRGLFEAFRDLINQPDTPKRRVAETRVFRGLCVASDDPRLH